MIEVGLRDPASGRTAHVGELGDVLVQALEVPQYGHRTLAVPFRMFFTDSAAVSDMRVDGSVTPVVYEISADPVRDRYIKSMSILIADATATLSQFGALTALTNGVLFEWDMLEETVELGVWQSNYDMVRAAGGQPAFGDGNGAFRGNNVIGTAEAYSPFIDFAYMFGTTYGIRLKAGTKERLCITIRDDLSTGIDAFNMQARGFELLPTNGDRP